MGVQREQAVVDLVINGKQAEATGKAISKTYHEARKALYAMAETDPGYQKQYDLVQKLLKAQQARIVKLNEEKTAWERFKAGAGGMITGIAGGNLLSTGIQKLLELGPAVVDRQLKIRDSFADIAKAADMTDSEVADLNGQLKKLDTRTATEELRNIAVVGGQFGIAKKDMADFVESADKLNVALGDQFDSVEKVAETSLTLRNTFQDIKSDNISDDMMRIGNGLNYLEAQGAATAPVMADFSSRIGGVAIPLGLTSGQVLGLSATLQELNVTAERGSSAMVDILTGITKAPETFAKYAKGVDGAKLSTKQFKDLINTDLNAAFMAVIRGFKEGDTSATGMAAKLEDMGIKGNGALEIFMKLASNTELLTKRQAQSAEALTNTSSITAEFSKKNYDLAVNLKKLGEWFDGFLENGTLGKFAGFIVGATVKLLGLNTEVNKATKNFAEQRTKVADLDKQLLPLIERYEKLTINQKQSREHQDELKKLTEQIAATMPSAVTGWDNYANALGISTTKARELIQAQRDLQRQMKDQARQELQQEMLNLEYQRKQILDKINAGEEVTVSASGNATARPLSKDDIAKMRTQLQQLDKKRTEILEGMREVEGMQTVAERRRARREAEGTNKPKPNSEFGTQETEEERKAREKQEKAQGRADKKASTQAQQRQEEYERMMAEARQRTAKANDKEFEAEQIQFGEHYSKLYDLAGKDKQKREAITQQMYLELASLQKKEDERQYKEEKKKSDELIRLAIKELDAKRDIALADIKSRQAAGGITAEQAKLEQYRIEETFLQAKQFLYTAHYERLKTLAVDNEKELTEIDKAQAATEEQIDADRTQSRASQADARKEIRESELEHERKIFEQKKAFAQEEKEFRQQLMGELSAMLLNDWTATLKGYSDFWQDASIVQKAAFIATKGYALAEIAVNLVRQLTLVNTAATFADSFLPGAGIPIRIKGYALAIGNAALQTAALAKVGVPAYELGGFSDEEPSGYTNGPTYYRRRGYIAGEKGREWIMSAPMLKNPVMANLAGALQALQVSGQWRTLTATSQGVVGSSGSSTSDQLMLQLINDTRVLHTKMEKVASRPIWVKYNHFAIRQQEDYLNEITEDTSLRRSAA